jgi:hypothetical protein
MTENVKKLVAASVKRTNSLETEFELVAGSPDQMLTHRERAINFLERTRHERQMQHDGPFRPVVRMRIQSPLSPLPSYQYEYSKKRQN